MIFFLMERDCNWLLVNLMSWALHFCTIFVTTRGDPRLAIEAMKEGVFDYINRL